MLRDGWELLVDEARQSMAQGTLQHIAVGVIAHWRSSAVIMQRGTRCYLPDQYEIPNDLLKIDESVEQGLQRVLHEQTSLAIEEFGGYLARCDYRTMRGEKARLFVFWAKVVQPRDLKPAPEFSHALFIFFDEAQRYGLIPPFLLMLIRFWFGSDLEENYLNALCEMAKKEGVWRHKVRVAVRRSDGHLLILKRPRRARFLPMLYEMPGGDVDYGESLFGACQRHLGHQTNLLIASTLEYLGHFDYSWGDRSEKIREFFILVEVTAAKSVQISDHAHALYADVPKFQKMKATKSCQLQFRAFHDRFFGDLFHPWQKS